VQGRIDRPWPTCLGVQHRQKLPQYQFGIAEHRHIAAEVFNAWCELAKSLKSKGGFTDTQTESRLVQRITPLFSMTASQQLTPSVLLIYSQRRAVRLFKGLLVKSVTNPTRHRRLGYAQTGIYARSH